MTDEELARLSLENADFFAQIVERYEKKLFNFIYRLSGRPREDIEDIVQNTFIKVYRNLNDFDVELKFSSWIYRVARNEAISHYRRSSARPTVVDLGEDNSVIESISSEFNLEREVDIKILREKFDVALQEIDKKYRDVLVLKFFEEKSYQEISDILKKPIGTVGALINRAKGVVAKRFLVKKI